MSPKCFAVTGCDSGFGRILTKMLADKGYVVFSGCLLKESIEDLKSENGNKSTVIPIQVDVTNLQSVENFAKAVNEYLQNNKGSQLDGLVNNAGILIAPCPVEWQDLGDFERMFKVNVMGTAAMTKSLLPFIRRSRGRIVNVASIAGRLGLPTQAAYCASKYAVEAYSDILRRDMLTWGVTVHIIEPGVFNKTGLYGDFEKGLDRKYQMLSEDVRKDYGEDFYKYVRQALTDVLGKFGNTNSNLVPEAMMHALLDERPKYRYRVGFDSKFIITPLSHLHESTQDTILTTPSPEITLVLPATAPENGKQLAKARYDNGSWLPFLGFMGTSAYLIKQAVGAAKL